MIKTAIAATYTYRLSHSLSLARALIQLISIHVETGRGRRNGVERVIRIFFSFFLLA